MSKYLIELYAPSGERLADISHLCLTRSYVVRRNRPEDIYLTLNLEKAQELARTLGMSFYHLFAAGITEVRITRGNRPMVGGQLLYVHPRLNASSPPTLELRAAGFLELFSKVYIHPNETANGYVADLNEVAWMVIDYVQSKTGGDFGVTQGISQPADRLIAEHYESYASSVKEILIGLTERIDAGDFEFTPDKVFNWYHPGIGTDKTELLFSYPGNITSIGLPQDATTLVNISINRGQGNGEVQPITTSTNDASVTTYGRREAIDDFPSITTEQTLQDKGDETIRLYSTPTTIPEITIDGSKEPFLGSYWIGDRVRFSVDTARYPAFALLDGQTWRINEIACVVDENDHEDITVKVGYS